MSPFPAIDASAFPGGH